MKYNPIIIALDFDSVDAARTLVRRLDDSVDFYKVGLELYAAAGIDFVADLVGEGKKVFLDLKLHDIPETVRRATAQIAQRGVQFLTVHAMSQVMKAAVDGKGDSPLGILGVTVLTSIDQADLTQDGVDRKLEEVVELRVRNAVAAGVQGIVCSPLEVARVRKIGGTAMKLVIPGVRSAGAATGDQKRVATPRQAIADGADYLVVGRQVTRADDPKAEVLKILEEIGS